jgi:hypothetical protein
MPTRDTRIMQTVNKNTSMWLRHKALSTTGVMQLRPWVYDNDRGGRRRRIVGQNPEWQ